MTGTVGDQEVTTYAFVRIPGDDDLTLALRPGAAQRVDELASVDFDMAALVAVPRRATLEVGADVSTTGVRADGRCSVSGTVVRYDAGTGSPWTDACRVPVRVAGTEEWTVLSVPIGIVAREPQPELRPGSLTVGPGETASFDLRNMTSWQLGREDWAGIRYTVEYAGSAFSSVILDGSVVTVTGADRAVPGSENAAIVSVTSHTAVAPARLLLRVGAAPSTLPQGGTTTLQCSQASGSSCTIDAVGLPGEVNPLPRTPLEVVSVRPTSACTGVGFDVASSSSVRASWTADAPGATCAASVTLRDAQSRSTAGTRDARVVLDLQGFPRSPASVRQTAYADGSLTLRVDAGEARRAYPALTGFRVRFGAQVVADCGADGSCPVIAAPNGEKREYVVTAVNGVGESRGSVRTTAWAYDPPARPKSGDFTPVVTRDGEGNVADLVIRGVESSETGQLEVRSSAGETRTIGVGRNDTDVRISGFRVGSNSQSEITVTPTSRFEVPTGLGGSAQGGALTFSAHGVGAPLEPNITITSRSTGDGMSTVTVEGTARQNGTDSRLRYGIAEGTACRVGDGGPRREFPNKEDGVAYTFTFCVESDFGGTSYGTRSVTQEDYRVAQDTAAPRGYTFTVGAKPGTAVEDGRPVARWRVSDIAAGSKPPRFNKAVYTNFDGDRSSVFGSDPNIGVYFQHEIWGTTSETGRVAPASGSAPYQVQATMRVASCVGGERLDVATNSSNDLAAMTLDRDAIRYTDKNGTVLPTGGSNLVPVGATRVENVRVTVDWSARGWGLDSVVLETQGPCKPGTPDREPEADPEP
ncbi:hypothetical protein M3D75_14060 [Microbacterium enclense]|uniref:hypothetical protein n=1 Tax=Microbacterium enclense TaxID=993073 RepID=UPI0021A4E5D9|nr:hypothetical protein [Microbacterium enclense]MCT2087244.1 hypothetical protein [Microbacterium enclense]